jgi:hypothetical protein
VSSECANVPVPGFAKVAGGHVFYLYDKPHEDSDLISELRVLQAFLQDWNVDTPVRTLLTRNSLVLTVDQDIQSVSVLPSSTNAPPLCSCLYV